MTKKSKKHTMKNNLLRIIKPYMGHNPMVVKTGSNKQFNVVGFSEFSNQIEIMNPKSKKTKWVDCEKYFLVLNKMEAIDWFITHQDREVSVINVMIKEILMNGGCEDSYMQAFEFITEKIKNKSIDNCWIDVLPFWMIETLLEYNFDIYEQIPELEEVGENVVSKFSLEMSYGC